MFDPYFWSVVVFFAVLATLVYHDRKNLEFHKLLIMKRTERGKKFIGNVANVSPVLWNSISTIGIIFAFLFMLYGTYILIISAQMIITEVITRPAIQFMIPVPQPYPINGTGFIGVPFWFWILVVPFVLFPHEFAHGVVARANKIKIKDVGLMQLFIFSGAFVEPDEKQLEKANLTKRLRVFSMGSVTNIAIALTVIFLTQQILWPTFVSEGVIIKRVFEGTGAEAAGLRSGMTIQEIDEKRINVGYDIFATSYTYLLFNGHNLTSENLRDVSTSIELGTILDEFEPNQTIKVKADGNIYNLKLSGRPENSTLPYIGISASTVIESDFMTEFAFPLIWWLTTISYFVAVFNLLPIYPLDGGLMLEAVVKKFNKKESIKITKVVTLVIAALLIFNFIGPTLISLI